jgi:hypothetical protein
MHTHVHQISYSSVCMYVYEHVIVNTLFSIQKSAFVIFIHTYTRIKTHAKGNIYTQKNTVLYTKERIQKVTMAHTHTHTHTHTTSWHLR